MMGSPVSNRENSRWVRVTKPVWIRGKKVKVENLKTNDITLRRNWHLYANR
jgi:hypothetical protein